MCVALILDMVFRKGVGQGIAPLGAHLSEEGPEQHRVVALGHARLVGGLSRPESGVVLILNSEPDRCSPVLETSFPAIRACPGSVFELTVRLYYHVSPSRVDGR